MKYEYRITKYNPSLRDPQGRYLVDEWTDYSDIGKEFNGITLTRKDYLKVERAYADAVINIITEAEIPSVTITCLENRKRTKIIRNGSRVSTLDLRVIASDILRGTYWAKLHVLRKAYVHFGWDYYMYVGTMRRTPIAIEKIKNSGLFVEEFPSPYK